jgi:hypothetical protein
LRFTFCDEICTRQPLIPGLSQRYRDSGFPHRKSGVVTVTVLELSCRPIPTVLAQRLADPPKVATATQLLAAIVRSFLIATLAAGAATVEAPTMGPTGGPRAGAIAAAEATRIATPSEPHRAASTPARRLMNYSARRLPRQATTTASPPSLRDFATSSSQRNSSL